MDDKNYSRLAQFQAFINEYKLSMEKYDCIEEIFKHDCDINYQIPDLDFIKQEKAEIIGCTALHLALNEYKTASFEKLLNHGADFTIKSNSGTTVLHQAIERSHNKSKMIWTLKGRLIHPRASLVLSAHIKRNILSNPCDNDGMSHFHIACMLNHIGAVQFFLNGGVSPNKAINVTSTKLPSYTPLHLAARYCSFETAQLLLKYNADKYSLDANSMTPLHLLLERRMEIMDHMHMDKRAAFDHFKDELDVNEHIVKLFIDNNDNQEYAGLSAFQAASTLQNTSLIEKLLEQHLDLNHTVSADSPIWPGYTALHFSSHCNFKTVDLLLSHGANVFAKDARGVTPFDLCLERYEPQDILVLLTAAMNQLDLDDIKFSDGKTKLTDLLRAMKDTFSLSAFLTTELKDMNIFLPHDSPLWPGYTPLHLAAVLRERIEFGIEDLYKTTDYVEEDCSMNYYNCNEIEQNRYELRIALLLQRGADVTIQDAYGSTPVHVAFPRKSESIFRRLLGSQRTNINPIDRNGLSHLHIACASRCHNFVLRILAVMSDNVDNTTISSFQYRIVVNRHDKIIRKFFINASSTLMHIAVATCNFDTIETLLQHNANLYVKDSLGMTPIHLILKSTELVHQTARRFKDLLLSVENLTDCVTDFGLSHLHVASHADHASAIKKLLDAGASIDTRINLNDQQNELLSFLTPYDSYTPLQMAISKGNDLSSEILMKRGADFLNIGAHLLCKMLKRRSPCRDIFVQNVKADATVQKQLLESYGLTMLHVACIANDIDFVVNLLDNGADPNVFTNLCFDKWSGYSPLLIIMRISTDAYEVQYKIIELLLNRGADVTLANSLGNTPIHEIFHLFDYEDNDYLELMLKYQKDYSLNPTNAKGVSHFHAACFIENASIVEEFLKQGVELNLKINNLLSDYGGYTPLHLAVYHNLGETIDLLLKYGANLNARDSLGRTPFHTAAKESMDFVNLFDRLVSAGADVHARTLLGATALEEVARRDSSNSTEIELLVKHGLQVHSFNPLTQEGLIGLSLDNGACDFSCNSFYEVVIDTFDVSDVDDVDRTPIHNIVSCSGFKMSTQAIAGLLKIGYDINHQDNQGRTALHCAAYFRNQTGSVGLLHYGADINIMDFNEKTAFTYFLERSKLEKSYWKNWERENAVNIVKTFLKHIYKLKLFNYHVNALDGCAYDKLAPKINLGRQFKDKCQHELEKTKKTIFESLSISLFDFLSSETRVIAAYPTMPLLKRQAINAVFEADKVLRHNFPQLYCLLRLQYGKVLARNGLVESAKYSLNINIGFTMPDLCSDIIFGFLTNQDLKNLISSTDDCCQPCKRRKLN